MIAARNLRADFTKAAARHALQAVDQPRERHLRGIVHQEVDVIVLARALHKLCFEVAANLGEDARQVSDRKLGEHVASVLREEDQMDV